MAKKPKIKPSEKIAARVLKRPVNDIVFDAMLRYGTYTVEDRAVPAQDGLKPVQRRILWAMNELGAKDHGYKTKCAKVVGQCFVAGTPVTTDKGEIAIEKIKIGDRVATRSGFNKVEKTFERKPESTLIVYFKDKQLTCTPDHKFLTLKKGEVKLKWVEARNLTKEHLLVSMDLMEDLEENKLANQLQKLTKYNFTPVSKVKKGPVAVTYDIRVENKHEFIANGVIVHNCMGSYHPHGDLSIYDALVRLVTSIPYPIIHGEGNFGSHNDPPAAYRYTTCHFTKFGYKIYFDPYYLRVIEKIPNYDGTTEEPMVLPALLPMSLIIPQSGIAVAISTNVPSFSVESIYKTISLMLGKGKTPSAKWLAHNLEWTSAFGGKVITEKDDLIPIMETGYGRVEWECDYKYDGKNTVTITGIPPGWNIESKIAAIAKEPYIAECAEQTDKGGLKIVIRFKRTDEEAMDENMHKFKKHLRSVQTISNNCIVRRIKEDEGFKETESDFKQRPITDILKEWCAWRIDLEKKALRFESKLVKESIERDKLLEKTIDNLDVIFALLKKKGIDKVKELAKKISITEEQSKFIWSIAVGRLDRLNMDSVQESIKKSKDRLRILKGKFENPSVSVLDQLKTMKLTA